MLQMTIECALQEQSITKDYCLYLYRDGDVIFYVGRSRDPLERLREHLGWGEYEDLRSHLGYLIDKFFPHSLGWIVELYTVAECKELVTCYRPEYSRWFEEQIEKKLIREASDLAEEVLIEHYRPCLNVAENGQGRMLPEEYK